MVIELWLIKNGLIFQCTDLKFHFRYNTLNAKGHEIFFICFIASKIRELNLLVMANIKV